ncbi:MAG: hypothetical protein GY856_29850, partial [bacterium]|nr:hypothetical protein [bacterium]
MADRRTLLWCSVLAGGAGAVYWIASFLLRPADPFSTLLMYRHGDCDYLPQIYRLAELGFREFMHYESLGSSILVFPVAGALPHAVALALFGNAGIVAADVGLSIA